MLYIDVKLSVLSVFFCCTCISAMDTHKILDQAFSDASCKKLVPSFYKNTNVTISGVSYEVFMNDALKNVLISEVEKSSKPYTEELQRRLKSLQGKKSTLLKTLSHINAMLVNDKIYIHFIAQSLR